MSKYVDESKQMTVDEYTGIQTNNLPNFLRNVQMQQQKTDTSHPDQNANAIEIGESGNFDRQRRSNSSGVLLLEVEED